MSKKLSLKLILRIIIPTLNSKSVLLLSLQTGFLLLRTYLSLVIARIDGLLVKHIVAKNKSSFFRILGVFFAISIPATYCNAMIKYLQSKIALQFRSLLTNHIHSLYLKNKNYYKAVNLDTRIGNTADQLITTDVKKFTEALSNLYSNLGKPVLDILIFNYQLGKSIGTRGMIGVGISYFSTALILRAATPKFGLMAAQEAMLEGDFRTAHARIITNAEEIAFYNGAEMEKNILQKTYTALIKHVNNVYKIRIAYNMFEDFLIKYTWSAVGLCLASIPVFFPQYAGKREQATGGGNVKSNAASFITNKRLMVGLADAGGRLMYSYKELVEMSGYASRVCSILNCLESLDQEQYVIGSSNGFDINNRKSKVEYGYPGIRFQNVPVVTPAGDLVMIRDLNLDIKSGDHIMITGGNGSGKTSVARIISGLWPIFTGVLSRPFVGVEEIMFISQRPYLSIGTLRDQLIYPHNLDDMRRNKRTDAELVDILKLVYLDYIPDREGGFDGIKPWKDVFSGGEKQRVQLARVFYHAPKFVVLDESTSAVSPDVEALMYTTAQEAGITLITISHKPSLWKYHTLLLKIGEGSGEEWVLENITSSNTLIESVEVEIAKIRNEVEGIATLKKRLLEINRELGLDVDIDDEGAKVAVKRNTI